MVSVLVPPAEGRDRVGTVQEIVIRTAAKITAGLRMRWRHPRRKPARARELRSTNGLQSQFPFVRTNRQHSAFFCARVAGNHQVIGVAFSDNACAAPFEKNHKKACQVGQILDTFAILDDSFHVFINDKWDKFCGDLEKSRRGNEPASRIRLTYAMQLAAQSIKLCGASFPLVVAEGPWLELACLLPTTWFPASWKEVLSRSSPTFAIRRSRGFGLSLYFVRFSNNKKGCPPRWHFWNYFFGRGKFARSNRRLINLRISKSRESSGFGRRHFRGASP